MSSQKSNENLKKKSTSTTTTTQTRIVTETHRHVTVKSTTRKERSRSVTYSSNIRESTSSGLQISFPALSNSRFVSSPTTSDMSLNDFGKIQLDVNPVNLHCYQSPYSNSPVYSTFHSSNKKTAKFTVPTVANVKIQAPSKEPKTPFVSSAFPTTSYEKSKSSSFNNFGKMELDVEPVNLNYQSPYRNSPVYASFQSTTKPKTTTFTPITTPKKTAPVTAPTVPNVKIQAPSKEPEKLVVKKTGKLYDSKAVIPTYKTSSKNRGEVLIINNIMFSGEAERKGAKMDDQKLEDLFKQIGFKVQVKRDLKCKDMQYAIESFSKKSSLKSSDISVVVVMSHGTKHDVWGTQVFGCDEIGWPVEQILNNFTSDKCKNMQDKPKIFIFQCCRGDNEQFVQSDAAVVKPPVRPYADMLIAYSTLPGFVAHRDPDEGTWYIQTLCEVFSKHAHEYHVEELLKIVDTQLLMDFPSRQTSSYESGGFKRCYFHPK